MSSVDHRESLDQEDIVAWINIGMHHIPQAEVRVNTSTWTVLVQHSYSITFF